MKYLADTHIWHRAVSSSERSRLPLSEVVLKIWNEEVEEVALCDISILELSRHWLEQGNSADTATAALAHAMQGLAVLPITPQVAVKSVALDWPKKKGVKQHRDPADRLIVATAIIYGLMILSEDEEIVHSAKRWGLTAIS